MATHCPVCNRKLSFLDWRQNCPGCGTNLMFHGFDERFFNDAKYAELGNAAVRVKWSKVLACLLGGKLQILRLCFILLPPAALLLPMGKLHIELPLFCKDISLGLLGVVSAFSDGTILSAFSLSGAEVTGAVADALKMAYLAFAAVIFCAVLIVLFQLLCFLSTKKMSVLLCIASTLGVAASLYGIFTVKQLVNVASSFDTLFSASAGFGCYAFIAAFIAVFIPNLLLAKRDIPIKYKEGDLYRIEVARKLKRGEIKLEDLSQPIFETEEERIIREEAIESTMNGKSSEESKREDGDGQ